jgi:hypothetical protein
MNDLVDDLVDLWAKVKRPTEAKTASRKRKAIACCLGTKKHPKFALAQKETANAKAKPNRPLIRPIDPPNLGLDYQTPGWSPNPGSTTNFRSPLYLGRLDVVQGGCRMPNARRVLFGN